MYTYLHISVYYIIIKDIVKTEVEESQANIV